MTVEVTAEHIAKGKRSLPWCCPVALAVREACGQSIADMDIPTYRKDVSVANGRIVVGALDCRIPLEVRAFIDRFDAGYTVEPFSFDLPEPAA